MCQKNGYIHFEDVFDIVKNPFHNVHLLASNFKSFVLVSYQDFMELNLQLFADEFCYHLIEKI